MPFAHRLLSAVLVVAIVFNLSASGIGGCANSRPTESKRLHFDLDQDGFLGVEEEYHLHVAGTRIPIQKHSDDTLDGLRDGSPGALNEPSHYADVELPSDRVVMMYITQRSDVGGHLAAAHGSDVDHGLALPFIHIPQDARQAALTVAKAKGLMKAQTTPTGCAADTNNDSTVTAEELNTYTPCDIAKTMLYHHPQTMNFDAAQGATVMTHIENAPGLDELALFIKSQGQHGWYTMPPILNEDGTQFTRTDTGAGVNSYVITDAVRQAGATAMQNTLINVTNDASLAGSSYNIVDGTTAVTQPSALTALGSVAKDQTVSTTFTLSSLGPQPGVSLTVDGQSGQDVTIGFTNYYIRHLALYIQFYDDADNLVTPTGWTSRLDFVTDTDRARLEDDTTKFISLINPAPSFLGIPLGSVGATDFTFTMPPNATYAKLLAGGLGSGGDRNSMVEEMGVGLTATFGLGIPGLLLLSTAAMSDLASALRKIYLSTSIISGVVKIFFSIVWGTGDHNFGKILSGATVFLGNLLVQSGFQLIVNLLAEAIAETAILDAIPFAGWITNAINIASTAALLAQTTAEVSTSPWVYENKLNATHNIAVTIHHDPDNFQFPAVATHYEVWAQFSEHDVQKSGPVALPGTTVSDPITYTFTGVPSGGEVDIIVGFYAANEWLAGHAELDGLTNLTPDGEAAMPVDITIKEELVPLDATSVYAHKEKLVFTGGVHEWQAAAAPTATLADLNASETGNALSELGNISLSQKVGAASYVWRSFSAGITDCLSAGSTGQLYTYQNISLTQNPETGLKFSNCGTSSKPYVILDLLGPADGTGNNFVIEPATDGFFYIRKFVLDASGNFNLPTGTSFGRFPMQLDAAALHPKGYILGINRSTSKIFQVKLPAAAVADASAPDALLFSGPATSLAGAEANANLLINPRAVALGTDGQFIILEDISTITAGTAQAGDRGRLRAFSEFGNPIKYFNGNYGALLETETEPVTYIDMGIESKGYIYVLSYVNDGHDVADYRMDIYNPDGTFLVRTADVAAARLTVDLWRNVNTLNFETIVGPGGRTEPSVSEWIPPAPPP